MLGGAALAGNRGNFPLQDEIQRVVTRASAIRASRAQGFPLECVVKLRANFLEKTSTDPHCTKTDQSVLYRLLLVVGDTGKLLRAACVAF